MEGIWMGGRQLQQLLLMEKPRIEIGALLFACMCYDVHIIHLQWMYM